MTRLPITHFGPPEDQEEDDLSRAEDVFLRDVPMDRCPWCRNAVLVNASGESATYHTFPYRASCGWDEDDTITENRIRYAAERLEEAKDRTP